jgi:hypothetical protein
VSNETFDKIKIQLEKVKTLLLVQGGKFSYREKLIVAAGCTFILVSLAYMIYEPVQRAFSEQGQRLEQSDQEMEKVAIALARYSKLKARRQIIENSYKEVEISEGVRSLLSGIIESKAGIPQGQFDIDARDARPFGMNYEQTPFRVRFIITDYSRLVAFLKEIVLGPKPLILTSLEIKKRQTADGGLEVDLDVSSIRQTNK